MWAPHVSVCLPRAAIQAGYAQKGRDGASFKRRREGYFGHRYDQRSFSCAHLVLIGRLCVFSVQVNVFILFRSVTIPTEMAKCYFPQRLTECPYNGPVHARRRF
jgi:hypothetical protein